MSTEKAPIAADEAQAWPELPDVDTAKMPEIATIVREQYLILGAIARAKPKFADDLALTLAKLRSMVMHLQIIFPTATPLVEVRYLITPDLMQEIRLATKDVVARVELMKGPTTTLTSGLRKAQVDPVQNAVIALESAIVTFKDLHQAARLSRMESKINEMFDMLSLIAGKSKASNDDGTLPQYSETSGTKAADSEATRAE